MTVEPLTLAVAQPLTIAHDVAGNAERHADAIRGAAADVVVFPELSLTGYEFDADVIDPSDERLGPVVDACGATNTVALVGAPVCGSGGETYIAMLAVTADGGRIAYRKMWLGEQEATRFAPGPGPAVIAVRGWRIGLAICKDTGVEQHACDTAALGIDVYVAGALEHEVDRLVQPARAVRTASAHDVWVAVASYAGTAGEGFDRAAGGSAIWRPDGEVVVHVGAEPGVVVTARLPAHSLRSTSPSPSSRATRA